MFHCRPEIASQAAAFLVGLIVCGALATTGCEPQVPAGNAATPAAPPGAPPPPPGAPSAPMGVEATGQASATPLDVAWSELIAIQEEQFNKLASIHNESQAEAAVKSAVGYHKKRHAALTKIAGLGGGKPPAGVPAKLREQYQAVENKLLARDEDVSGMINPAKREQLNQQLRQALQADPELAKDPFALSAETRTVGSGNIATVTLVNNQSLQGPAHQLMIARLQQLAGASKAESVIENDGTYKVVLSPVADFDSFVRGINFGDISNRSDTARTFTLTIDPERFQAGANVGGAGPFPGIAGATPGTGVPGSPPGFPPPGAPVGDADQQKAAFFSRNGGPEKCAAIVLADAPGPGTPEGMALLATAKQISRAQKAADLRVSGQRLILLAPVEDVAGLAAKIDFGTVTGHDLTKREIYVKIASSSAASP